MIAAVVLATSPAPAPAPVRSPAAECPRERVRVIEESNFEFPEDAQPTHERVRFLVDLGSDGRIRRTATAESSGDAGARLHADRNDVPARNDVPLIGVASVR
jgi:hypothetical protein